MFAVLFLFLIGFTAAQLPQPCMTPPEWEARIFEFNEMERFSRRAHYSYDSVGHRERIIEEVDFGSEEAFYDVIALFDSNMEYIYNLKSHNCTRRPITRPWRDFGIQPGARSYGEAYIGTSAAPGFGLLVNLW